MRRDSVGRTILVAAVLCVVCSVLVSAAAVGLRSRQEANKARYQKKNILVAAGLDDENVPIDQLFERIETLLIDLDTGEVVPPDEMELGEYDQRTAPKDPELSVPIEREDDIAGIKRREKYSKVYLVKDDEGKISQIVLPVYGKGLWSTLYGFVAIKSDLNTIAGLTFYEHAETPGLGGEIENEAWKAKWTGKKIYDNSGEIQVEVVKGSVDPNSPKAEYQVDGLSGATITSRGVSDLLRYWIGNAFAPFLGRLDEQLESGGPSNG